MNNLRIPLILLIVASIFSLAPTVYAACPGSPDTCSYFINGSVNLTGGSGISGAIITVGSNTTTTNASGQYSLASMGNSSSQGALNGTAYTLVVTAAGYTRNNSVTIVVNGSNNNTGNATLPLITPVQSGVAASSITSSSATISLTVTATDYVNNNYVGNRLRYSLLDSDLVNNVFTLDWSNSTASPSFSLTNLNAMGPGRTIYYAVDTYNLANGANTQTTTGSFVITGRKPQPTPSLAGQFVITQTPIPPPAPKSGVIDKLFGGGGQVTGQSTGAAQKSAANKRAGVFIVAMALVAGIVVYAFHNRNSGSSNTKPRKTKKH